MGSHRHYTSRRVLNSPIADFFIVFAFRSKTKDNNKQRPVFTADKNIANVGTPGGIILLWPSGEDLKEVTSAEINRLRKGWPTAVGKNTQINYKIFCSQL